MSTTTVPVTPSGELFTSGLDTAGTTVPNLRSLRAEPIHFRADRVKASTVRCTYVGDFSRCQCLMQATPGTDRCNLPGHERSGA